VINKIFNRSIECGHQWKYIQLQWLCR